MKVIVAGSRDVRDFDAVSKAIKDSGFEVTLIIHEGARGVDTLAEKWAVKNDIPFEKYPADWDQYNKAAGHIRNSQMAAAGEALVAIRKDGSRGTTNMIEQAKKKGLPVYIVEYEGSPEKVPLDDSIFD